MVTAKAHGYPHTETANPHWTPLAGLKELEHIPGETGLPILGNTIAELADPSGFLQKMYEKHGAIFRGYSLGQHYVALLGAEANEMLLLNRDKLFSSEQGWGPTLNNLFPRGLMLMDAERHRADRKALSIAFKPEPMKDHCARLNIGIAKRTAEWSGSSFKFYDAIKSLSLDLAASTILGIPWGDEADKINRAFVDELQASVGIVRSPWPFTRMRRGVQARQYLLDYFRPQVIKRRNDGGEDIFSQICNATHEDGELLTEEEVVDHINFLMMAAHDTITSSATSLVYFLAKQPELQDRLREECLDVAPAGSTVAYEDLDKFAYTEMAFKEALRMIPPVSWLSRRALGDIAFRNHNIPKGTLIGVSPSFVHMMEEHWPEPDKFDPTRFTAKNSAGRHKYAWVPFGGGAHMCLGLHFAYMQIKILMHAMLTQNRILFSRDGNYEPEWQMFPIPRPKDRLPIRLKAL